MTEAEEQLKLERDVVSYTAAMSVTWPGVEWPGCFLNHGNHGTPKVLIHLFV